MIDRLPDDIFKSILEFNPNAFLFSGILNKNTYYRSPSKTGITSVLESTSRLEESLQNGLKLPDNILEIVAEADKPDMVFPLLENGIEWDHFCIEKAVLNNSISFIIFINESDLFWLPENAFISAIENRNLALSKFIHASGMGFPDERCMIHAQKEQLHEVIEWLELIEESDEYIAYVYTKKDDLDNIIRMWENGFNFSRLELGTSCVNGSTKCFKFIVDLGLIPGKREYHLSSHMNRDEISSMILQIIEFDKFS